MTERNPDNHNKPSRFDRLESIIYIVLASAVLGMVAYGLWEAYK